jgi:hypothetical protein
MVDVRHLRAGFLISMYMNNYMLHEENKISCDNCGFFVAWEHPEFNLIPLEHLAAYYEEQYKLVFEETYTEVNFDRAYTGECRRCHHRVPIYNPLDTDPRPHLEKLAASASLFGQKYSLFLLERIRSFKAIKA